MPVKVDTVQRWLDAHPEEVALHEGKFIAVHGLRGIVASDESIVVVHKMLEDSDLLDNVGIIQVPWNPETHSVAWEVDDKTGIASSNTIVVSVDEQGDIYFSSQYSSGIIPKAVIDVLHSLPVKGRRGFDDPDC